MEVASVTAGPRGHCGPLNDPYLRFLKGDLRQIPRGRDSLSISPVDDVGLRGPEFFDTRYEAGRTPWEEFQIL
jgi:hypothetical protein